MSTNRTDATEERQRKRPRDHRSNFSNRRGRPRRRNTQPRDRGNKVEKIVQCTECNKEDPKYKCPKCRAAYCSVACCKLHKQNNCTLAQPPAEQAKPKSRYLPSDLLQRDPDVNSKVRRQQLLDDEFDDLDDGWKITADMMNAMDKSDWLHRELADGGLRQIITEIVTASKNVSGNGKTFQSEALSQFQSKFPNFRTFLDKLLVITGVLERQNEEMEEELADWLLRKEDLGDLALKPICKERSQDSNENEYPTRTSTSPSGDSSSCTDTSDSD